MSSYPGSQTKITLTHDKESTADLKMKLITQVLSPQLQVSRLVLLLQELGMGSRNGSIDLTVDDGNAVTATASVTFTGTPSVGDTIVLNGVQMTAVASGATPQQWNVGASATAAAANVATAVAAANSALISGLVTAVASTSIVTFSAVFAGLAGNTVTIASTTGANIAVSGARLVGGLAATTSNVASTYKHGV